MKFERDEKLVVDVSKDLTFQIVSWYSCDEEYGEEDGSQYLVKLFGVAEDGRSVSANLVDFPPFFYVRSPFPLNDYQLRMFKDFVVTKLPYSLKDGLSEVKPMRKKDFWGFTNQAKFMFLRLSFKNLQTFRSASRIFQRKVSISAISRDPMFFKLYESNIDPFLRLAHIRDIDPAGWVRIPAKSYESNSSLKPTRCQIDVTARWKTLEPASLEKMAPLIVAAFDIECTSSHGDFPVAIKSYKKTALELYHLCGARAVTKEETMREILLTFDHAESGSLSKVYPKQHVNPKDIEKTLRKHIDDIYALLQGRVGFKKLDGMKRDDVLKGLTDAFGKCLPSLEGDPIIQIGTTVHRYGEPDCSYKHIITLGSCDEIEGAVVEACKTERELLLKWRDMIQALDPDVMIGYNIFGFDMSYMVERSKENNIDEAFREIGRMIGHPSEYVEKTLSSSALGDNLLRYVDMEGRVLIDMMKVVQRDHKLDSYKLDAVSTTFLGGKILSVDGATAIFDNIKGISIDSYVKLSGDEKHRVTSIESTSEGYSVSLAPPPCKNDNKWGLAKDDLSPREIFECQSGDSSDRARVARYCLKDCSLCNFLLMKLETLANNVGMANVCSVPLSFIFMRGQGIKIFSLVAKQCRQEDFVIPCLTKYQNKPEEDEDEDGYEGAIVLEPKEGIYIDTPISVLDYASLYPSSMISENLSHDCIVLDSKYDNLPDVEYLDITYDIYEKVNDKKVKSGERRCRFAQLPEKGTIPRILMHLLKQRKLTRKKIEFETVFCKDGRSLSGLVSQVEGCYRVAQLDGTSELVPADEVSRVFDTYDDFQKAVLDGLQVAYKVTANSLYGQCGARTSQIYMKDIAACTTATGRKMILMAKDFIEKKSVEFKIPYEPEIVYGDSVTGDTPLVVRYPDGRIDVKTIDSISSDWIPYENFKPLDADTHEKQQSFIDADVWADGEWASIRRVIRHKTNKKLYRVNTFGGCVDVTEDHSLLDAERNKLKPGDLVMGETKLLHSFPREFEEFDTGIDANAARDLASNIAPNGRIPASILNGTREIREAFLKQYELEHFPGRIEDKCLAQGIYVLMRSLGRIVQDIACDTAGGYWIFNNATPGSNINAVKSVIEIGGVTEETFVYDIETSKGIFMGGVGSINVSNTDSIFVKFDFQGEDGMPIKGKDGIPLSRELGIKISKAFKAHIKHPHDLEWEKLFYPFVLFSKKRYCANKYEHDDNKYKMNSMGIVLKRRDNAQIVKTIYGGILNIILNEQNIRKSIAFLQDNLQDMIDGKFPLEELIITKSLRGEYKDPDKIAHKVLADRMGERDEGNRPQVNDRIPFVYVQMPESKGKKMLQGERIEHPDYIRDQKLKPDYEFYITNQVMKPCLQLYALVLETLPGYKKRVDYGELKNKLLKEKEGDAKKAKDKWNDLREDDVKKLLFDPFLIKLQNKRIGNRSITEFFGTKP